MVNQSTFALQAEINDALMDIIKSMGTEPFELKSSNKPKKNYLFLGSLGYQGFEAWIKKMNL